MTTSPTSPTDAEAVARLRAALDALTVDVAARPVSPGPKGDDGRLLEDVVAGTPRRHRRGVVPGLLVAAACLVALVVAVSVAGRGGDPVETASGDGPSTTAAPPATTEPERVTELWRTYRTTAECLEEAGYDVIGPYPRSDGLGLDYTVVADESDPNLEQSNGCEAPLDAPAMDIVGSATPEEQAALAAQFNDVMACLGLDQDPVPTSATGGGELARDVAAERAVDLALWDSPRLRADCVG